jgi:hypothetical protein
VDLIARRFRGVLIAIVVLGISAGAVFAGHVVLQAPATTPTASEQGDQDEQADENDNEAPETDKADQDAPDANDGTGNTADNHGALVSRAAQMEAPVFTEAGAKQFANHGAFVSCVAQIKTLPEGTTAATFDFSTVTPDFCDTAAAARAAEKAATKADRLHGKAGQHGKGHNRS